MWQGGAPHMPGRQEQAAWPQHPKRLAERLGDLLRRKVDDGVEGHGAGHRAVGQVQGQEVSLADGNGGVALPGLVQDFFRQVQPADVQPQARQVRCRMPWSAAEIPYRSVWLHGLGKPGQHLQIHGLAVVFA